MSSTLSAKLRNTMSDADGRFGGSVVVVAGAAAVVGGVEPPSVGSVVSGLADATRPPSRPRAVPVSPAANTRRRVGFSTR